MVNLFYGQVFSFRYPVPRSNDDQHSGRCEHKARSCPQVTGVDIVHVGHREGEDPSGHGLRKNTDGQSLGSQPIAGDFGRDGPASCL